MEHPTSFELILYLGSLFLGFNSFLGLWSQPASRVLALTNPLLAKTTQGLHFNKNLSFPTMPFSVLCYDTISPQNILKLKESCNS